MDIEYVDLSHSITNTRSIQIENYFNLKTKPIDHPADWSPPNRLVHEPPAWLVKGRAKYNRDPFSHSRDSPTS